jgi:hypothetical protein
MLFWRELASHSVNNCGSMLNASLGVSNITVLARADASLGVSNITVLALADTHVDIHLHSGNLEDGSTVAMPVRSIVQWRVVGGHSIFGAWNSYTVVNGGVLNAVTMACTMTIKAPAGIG